MRYVLPLTVGAFVLGAVLTMVFVLSVPAPFTASEPLLSPRYVDVPRPPADPYGLKDWVRPEGPPTVSLQAGHWRSSEVPDELDGLRGNGAQSAGIHEYEVNLAIAELAKAKLEPHGILVNILPTTVPPDHYADIFIAIHADGNPNPVKSGYRAAAPWRDETGKAQAFVDVLDERYGERTGLQYDPVITRNMRGYYAFNWRRYEHALHPMTTAVILETGYLTSPTDRRIIVGNQNASADAIADAVIVHLMSEGLLPDGALAAEPSPEG